MTLPLEPRGTLDVNGDIVLGKNEEGTTIPVSEKSQVDIYVHKSLPTGKLKERPGILEYDIDLCNQWFNRSQAIQYFIEWKMNFLWKF